MRNIFLSLSLLISSTMAMSITIDITGVNVKKDGELYVGLYNSKDSFKDRLKTYKNTIVGIYSNSIEITFKDIPKGVYAIAVFHDENKNGKLDKNFFGVPTEGYGFSNNIKPALRGANFDESKFDLYSNKKITVKMRY